MRRCVALTFFLICAAGCAGPTDAPKVADRPKSVPVVDPWILGTTDATAPEPALLWNGQIGIRIARNGAGTPNAFFSIDAYQSDGEEKIILLPNPLSSGLDIDLSKSYSQKLDMRTGILTTSFAIKQGGSATQELVLHPAERQLGERWTLSGGAKSSAPRLAVNAEPLVRAGVKVRLKEAPTPEGIERAYSFGPSRYLPAVTEARLGGALVRWSAWWAEPATPLTFAAIEKASRETWAKRWKTDIEIEGPVEDQQAIRSFLFYLRSAIDPKQSMSISPFGLSSAKYNGHVFWDADLWVMPGLALVDPPAARAIVQYRLMHLDQAKRNFADWTKAGRPTSSGHVEGKPPFVGAGAKFPWESSVTGKETVTADSRFEDHITGCVAHAAEFAAQLGVVDGHKVGDLETAAGYYYASRIQKRPDGSYDLRGTMSPDENHLGDNDLFTNILAQSCIDRIKGKILESARPKLHLPKDEESLLTYDNDRLRGYKQAAAVLSIYPLQFGPAEKQAAKMMERFADKTTPNGPAMSDSVHGTIWARLGEKDKAYAAWKSSWEPFTRHPLMLFAEKRKNPETYFTTGAGGALQTVLFGFLGMRIDWKQEPGSAWSTRTDGGAYLSVKPNLPREWKSVKFRNFAVCGKRYTLEVRSDAVRVVPGG